MTNKKHNVEELNKYSGCFKYTYEGNVSAKYLFTQIDMMQNKINELIKIMNDKL